MDVLESHLDTNSDEFKAKKVTFNVYHTSKGAIAAIEAAGGKVDILGVKPAVVKNVKTSKKSKKAQSLKMKIKPTGSTLSKLQSSGSVKVKVKATFKPSSGISVSKTKSIVLKLR